MAEGITTRWTNPGAAEPVVLGIAFGRASVDDVALANVCCEDGDTLDALVEVCLGTEPGFSTAVP